MTNPTETTGLIQRLLSVAGATLLAAVSAVGCSGSAMESAPFAPSAMPASTLSAEAGESSASFDALGKGTDKGTDKGADKGADKGKDKDKSDSGRGSDSDATEEKTTASSNVVEAEGAIVTATGTCPAKTFTIGTRSFTTDAATTYQHGTCADLAALAEVEVHATTAADGRLTATRVEFKSDEDGDRRGNPHDGPGPFDGTVSMFRGTCPVVSFNLKGMRVSTTKDTTYEGVAEGVDGCSLLRPNVKVIVTGTPGEARRAIIATTITIVRTH
jgi:hypothetical protein